MKCITCGKEMRELDFHELATMFACTHGHYYGVYGPDDVFTELVPKPQLVNTAILQDVHADSVNDCNIIVAKCEYVEPLDGQIVVARDHVHVHLKFSLDDACVDLSNEQKRLINDIVARIQTHDIVVNVTPKVE